eukprot:s5926_g2.t3
MCEFEAGEPRPRPAAVDEAAAAFPKWVGQWLACLGHGLQLTTRVCLRETSDGKMVAGFRCVATPPMPIQELDSGHQSLHRGRRTQNTSRSWRCFCIFSGLMMASSGLICFIDMREVQHPLDRGGDVVLSPFWQLAEPVACFLSSILFWPVRLQLRLQSGMAALDRDLEPGRTLNLHEALERASRQSCSTLQQLFQVENACPQALLVRSSRPHVAILPSRFGRRRILVVTDALVTQLSDAGLRFVVGREIGRSWLHHGDLIAAWTLQHFVRQMVFVPLHVFGLRPASGRPELKRSPEEIQRRVQVRRFIDAVADVCDVYRGLRSGRWPGLADLDVDDIWGPGERGWPVHNDADDGMFAIAAICSRLRAPGGVWALGAAVAGSATPRLLAEIFSLPPHEERQLRRCLRFGTWGLGLWAAKARAEVFSADRLGLIAAGGDLDAALRAMVAAANSFNDVATAALIGVDELVRQAQYLSSVMPPSYLFLLMLLACFSAVSLLRHVLHGLAQQLQGEAVASAALTAIVTGTSLQLWRHAEEMVQMRNLLETTRGEWKHGIVCLETSILGSALQLSLEEVLGLAAALAQLAPVFLFENWGIHGPPAYGWAAVVAHVATAIIIILCARKKLLNGLGSAAPAPKDLSVEVLEVWIGLAAGNWAASSWAACTWWRSAAGVQAKLPVLALATAQLTNFWLAHRSRQPLLLAACVALGGLSMANCCCRPHGVVLEAVDLSSTLFMTPGIYVAFCAVSAWLLFQELFNSL